MTQPLLREATPREVRQRIDNIPPEVKIQFRQSPKVTYQKLDGKLIQTLDKFLYLSGCRVSEAVTRETTHEQNRGINIFGPEATLDTAKYHGEEIAIFNLRTLKRRDHITRTIALPLNPEYEPWTRDIVDAWKANDGKNPWSVSRGTAYKANHQIFQGLEYAVMGRDAGKPAANHALRHFRIKELIMTYGFTPLEVQRWVGWTAGGMQGVGVNPMMDRYFSLGWQDYISKLLIKRN